MKGATFLQDLEQLDEPISIHAPVKGATYFDYSYN